MFKNHKYLSIFLAIGIIATTAIGHDAVYADQNITFLTQKKLKEKGYDPGVIDGIMGEKTISAIKKMQAHNFLPITGKIDAETKKILGIKRTQNKLKTDEGKVALVNPKKLLPDFTIDQDCGTKVVFKKGRTDDSILMVIPSTGDYSHQFILGSIDIEEGIEMESSAWSHNAVHEIHPGVSVGGYTFNAEKNTVLIFSVDVSKGYVFRGGDGNVQLPDGSILKLDQQQIGIAIGSLPGSKESTNNPQKNIGYVSSYKKEGLYMQAPKGWVFMSPEEVRRKIGNAMKIAPNAIFFVINEEDFDSNINVQYLGDASKDAPNRAAAIKLLEAMQRQIEPVMQNKINKYKKIKSEIIDFSDGVALNLVSTSFRGKTKMKQKQLVFISNDKAFTITCTAKMNKYDRYFRAGFQPILNSIKIE